MYVWRSLCVNMGGEHPCSIASTWRTTICRDDCDFLRMRKEKTAPQRMLVWVDKCRNIRWWHIGVHPPSQDIPLSRHPPPSVTHFVETTPSPHYLVHDDEGERWDLPRTPLEQQVLGLGVRARRSRPKRGEGTWHCTGILGSPHTLIHIRTHTHTHTLPPYTRPGKHAR